MYNSKSIDDLRPDVAANCRIFLELCHGQGLNALVTGTVRDEEYQLYCYEQGYSRAKRPAFHAQGIGLAFDFCKNVKGHEYDDLAFFERCGKLGEAIGFEWGGRWTSFPDRPHLQWSGPKHDYKSSDLWAGELPPNMPLYYLATPEKELSEVTQEEFNAMLEAALTAREATQNIQPASGWAASDWTAAKEQGVFDGSKPLAYLTREQAATVFKRMGLLR